MAYAPFDDANADPTDDDDQPERQQSVHEDDGQCGNLLGSVGDENDGQTAFDDTETPGMIGSEATIWETPKASSTPLHGMVPCTAPKQQTSIRKSINQSTVAMITRRNAAPFDSGISRILCNVDSMRSMTSPRGDRLLVDRVER